MFRYLLPLLLLVCVLSNPGWGQNRYTVSSARAIKAYEKAAEFFQNGLKDAALRELDDALKKENEFVEAWLFKADILHEMGQAEEEILCYQKAIAIDPEYFPNVHFNLGNALFRKGEYQEARKSYQSFLTFIRISSRNQKLAKRYLKNCIFALDAMKHPVDFHPINLGDSVNTSYDEYWPSLTADEERLIFTSLVRKNITQPFGRKNRQEDFFEARKTDTCWRKALPLGAPLNSEGNEGAQSITADGRLMYFTACGRPDGRGRCDIYYAVKQGKQWSPPVNLGAPVNTGSWEAQPSISADGRVLYFVSNRKGGKGKMDIWRSSLLEVLPNGRQRWSKPENLSFNTLENEMSPFIHAGNSSLYFASDGLIGMGGYDLYHVNREGKKAWSEPQNMGYPINTHGDEMGLIINARGNRAYFASNREEGRGRDIYQFALPKKLQPVPASYLKGRLYDALSNMNLQANVELVDLQTNDTIAILQSDRLTGGYLVCLPAGKEYAFNAGAPGYLFHSEYFSMKKGDGVLDPQHLDIGLKPIREGETVVLHNVFFDSDSWQLKPESRVELQNLAHFLNQQSRIRIEIGGHTDNTGTSDYNIELSRNRAKSVYEFLLEEGIAKERLAYEGYGAIRPIASNDTEEGKARNRRTEFKILAK